MWGADKIPDHIFERIPGGYYKAKADAVKQDDKSEDMKQRKHSRRRHSEGDDRRGRRDRDDADGGRDSRQSYDGGDDDENSDNFDSINNRPRRQRSRVDLYRNDDKRRSRSHRNGEPRVDGGFSYHDGVVVPPPTNFDEALPPRGPPSSVPSSSQYPSTPYSPTPNGSIHSQQGQAAHRSTSTLRGGLATGYVPYADIYGGPTYQAPPPSDVGSVQPNEMNQVAPPVARQPYQQNPFAQEAPLGAQPAYLPDPYYNARRYDDQYDDRQSRRDDGFNDRRHEEDESATEREYSRSPPRRRHSTRDGRSRPHREKSQGRGKSGIRGAVDTSERGLGYSAVGALAGGLVGSELGKGLVPTAIGSALGAIGANAFQARERYVDPRAPKKQSKPQPPR